jgi:hypothetical protein
MIGSSCTFPWRKVLGGGSEVLGSFLLRMFVLVQCRFFAGLGGLLHLPLPKEAPWSVNALAGEVVIGG